VKKLWVWCVLATLGACSTDRTMVTMGEPIKEAQKASNEAGDLLPELTGCEIIQKRARRVLEVSPAGVTIRVLAEPQLEGRAYVRVWYPERHARHIGDYELGDIFIPASALDGPGQKTLAIDIEFVASDGRFFQCDGGLSFEIPASPPPTTTTVPVPPPTTSTVPPCPAGWRWDPKKGKCVRC